MRAIWLVLSVAATTALAAQNPVDSGVADDSGRLDVLRQEILDRYQMRAHEVLSLSGDQADKFDATQSRAWGQRRQLMIQRQRLNLALRGQMQLGGAANADSVNQLLEARRGVTESLLHVDDQEDQELAGFLNPVQRARYQEFRQHFRERVAEVMRNNRGGMLRPGSRPRMRPGLRPGVGRRGRP